MVLLQIIATAYVEHSDGGGTLMQNRLHTNRVKGDNIRFVWSQFFIFPLCVEYLLTHGGAPWHHLSDGVSCFCCRPPEEGQIVRLFNLCKYAGLYGAPPFGPLRFLSEKN